jgi:hypothetical protein
MAKAPSDPKRTNPPPPQAEDEEDAALCQHELDARRENALRAKRKREVES